MPALRRCLSRLIFQIAIVAVGAACCAKFDGGCSARAQEMAFPAEREHLLAPYADRLETLDSEREWVERIPEMPGDYESWWREQVEQPLRHGSHGVTIQVESLVLGALHHSPKIRVLSDIPLIRRTACDEAEAFFDTYTFLESKFVNTNDPAGSTLITGGPDRLLDENWTFGGGLRRRTLSGGQWELSQRFGYEQSNSIYFTPPDQGTARMSLSFTQPLLNGAGRRYNESVMVLASLDASVATDEFLADLQSQLYEVMRAYWDLYLERAAYLQRQRLYDQVATIVTELEARRSWDASQTQLLHARAAAARRLADLNMATHSVRNAEARIIAVVNDPQLLSMHHAELLPVQPPYTGSHALSLRASALTALQNRPEVDKAIKEIKAASVRAGVATKDLLPALNLVMAAYVSGLQGNGQIGDAFGEQFQHLGEPSYTVGLQLEVPLGNRAARARQERQLLEVRRFSHQLQATVAALLSDVENAVREVDAAYQNMHGRYHAMMAAKTEIERLTERYRLLPGDAREAGLVLESLLNAQVRAGEEEYGFAHAMINYNLAHTNLQRATGTLLQQQQVELVNGWEQGLPTTYTTQSAPAAMNEPPELLESIFTAERSSMSGIAPETTVR